MRRRARRRSRGSAGTQVEDNEDVTERAITSVVILGLNKRLVIGNGEEDLTYFSGLGCDDGPLPIGKQKAEEE